jgi:hypothetical protein
MFTSEANFTQAGKDTIVAVLKCHITRIQRDYGYFYLPHQMRGDESA